MRMKLNGFSVALMIICATLLAGIVVTCINCLAPFFIFGFSTCDVILMGLVNMVFVLCFLCALGLFVCHRMGKFDTSHRTILSFSALLFVLRHWFTTARAARFYFHAIVANAFDISRFFTLESLPAHKARFTYATSWGIYSGRASSARFAIQSSKFSYLRRRCSAFCAWRKIGGVASGANSISPCIVVAYLASVFHVANIPQVAY